MLSELTNAARSRLRARFERGGWVEVWHFVYLAALAAATAAAVTDAELSVGRRAAIAALAIAELGWYALIALRWRYWEAPPARFALALAVAGALWFPLMVWHRAFGWTIPAAYGAASCPWLRRSIPSIAILSALVLLADHLDGGSGVDIGLVTTVVVIAGVVLLGHATVGAIAHESERRRTLIEELEATRAELAASERTAGALAERERLARDIHDALAQGFTSIVMLLEAADANLPAGSAATRGPLDQALQTARDSLAEARRIVWALRPETDDPGALPASLERLAERTTAGGGATVDVVVTGEPRPLDAGRELVLLRAAQEAVANASRHSGAAQITITVSWLGDAVILDVVDDGRGFDPGKVAARPGGGFGLTSLAQRARDAGGELAVDSTPGQGTTVSLALPLASNVASTPAPVSTQPSGAP